MKLAVTVRPGCRTEAIEERPGGPLFVRVRAPAKEGRANEAVVKLVARHLGVPRSAVRVVRGLRGRDKLLEITGRD